MPISDQNPTIQGDTDGTSIGNVADSLKVYNTNINISASGIFTDRSGTTSGTPSTSTQIMAANSSRKYVLIQNVSNNKNIWINFTSAATATQPSIILAPNASFVMESNFINTEAINVLCTTASQPYTAKEG